MESLYSRKAQITLIVIVGLVLVLVFIFLFSFKKLFNGDSDEPGVNKVLYELESGLIKDHVTSCIFNVGSDGLEKLGANGGVIYDFEGGTIPFASSVEGVNYLNYTKGLKKYFVQYGLMENDFCPAINYSTPGYPFSDALLGSLEGIYNSNDACSFNHSSAGYDGFFGKISVSKLCPFLGDFSCEPFAKGDAPGLTWQNQLQDYIVNKLPLCVNMSGFEEDSNAMIQQDGVLSANVFVRDDQVQVSVRYPFKVTFKDAAPISKVVVYQAPIKVRLGYFYNFAYDILSKDARDINFDKGMNSLASVYYKPGFKVRKIANACADCKLPYAKDDLLEFIDEKSFLKGVPFVIRLAIKDRQPSIDFIPDVVIDLSAISPHESSEIIIPVRAIDPDDTTIKYVFMSEGKSGWREDESNIFFEIDNNTFYRFEVSADTDFGDRLVRVLAYDEDNQFDYQEFKVRVQDTAFLFSQAQACIDDCIANGGDLSYCNDWCWISANPCKSYCNDEFDASSSQCSNCVDNIYYATELERGDTHPDCNALVDFSDCDSKTPDCFWVLEMGGSSEFLGSCYNDRDLNRVKRPAYLVTNKYR